jgi:uncharacterized membrane protein
MIPLMLTVVISLCAMVLYPFLKRKAKYINYIAGITFIVIPIVSMLILYVFSEAMVGGMGPDSVTHKKQSLFEFIIQSEHSFSAILLLILGAVLIISAQKKL